MDDSTAPFVTLSAFVDEGALEVAREALEAAEIPVEVVRRGDAYFGSLTPDPFELRVPQPLLDDALRVLRALAVEIELTNEGATDEEPPPAERPRRLSYAVALALLLPFPVSCLYARARRLAYVLLGAFGAGGVALVAGGNRAALYVLVGAKVLDAALAPLWIALTQPGRRGRVGAGLVFFVAVTGAATVAYRVDHREQTWREGAKRSTEVFDRAMQRLREHLPEEAPVVFPDVPTGHVHALFYARVRELRATGEALRDAQRAIVAIDDTAPIEELQRRLARSEEARRILDEDDRAWQVMFSAAKPEAERDPWARDLYDSLLAARTSSTPAQRLRRLTAERIQVFEQQSQLWLDLAKRSFAGQLPPATELLRRDAELREQLDALDREAEEIDDAQQRAR
jgi:hypothetical protein